MCSRSAFDTYTSRRLPFRLPLLIDQLVPLFDFPLRHVLRRSVIRPWIRNQALDISKQSKKTAK